MGNLHLVTGYAGSPHVTAEDHGSMFEASIRSGQYVLDAGECFFATVIDNNTIQIADGELMMRGRHVKLDPGKTVNVTIESGVLGQERIDYIVARYTRSTADGVEDCNLVVVKGTPAASDPAAPKYSTGDINGEKALVNDFPLYKVTISGLTLGSPLALFTPQPSLAEELHALGMKNPRTNGCFYREYQSGTEWLNPPMELGASYRTAERWKGYPVFVETREVSVVAGGTINLNFYGASDLRVVFLGYRSGRYLLDFSRDNPGVSITYNASSLWPMIQLTTETAIEVVCMVKYTTSIVN